MGGSLTNPNPRVGMLSPKDAIAAGMPSCAPDRAFLAGGGEDEMQKLLSNSQPRSEYENPENLVKSAPGTPQMRQVKKKEK
jgi:hypothetical protein